MATDTALERPLPHNLEAERSILGAVILDNHALNAAVEKLRAEDFFLSQHRLIFSQMVQLAEKQEAIDTITLMEDLLRRNELEAAGGIAYLSQLTDGLPRLTNVEHYARIVKEKAVLRSLIYSASAIQEQALVSYAPECGHVGYGQPGRRTSLEAAQPRFQRRYGNTLMAATDIPFRQTPNLPARVSSPPSLPATPRTV